jgi:hypothetical protein
MRVTSAKDSGFGARAPGVEVLTMKAPEGDEMGMVSLYADVPSRSLALSYVRFNLFSCMANTLSHVASAICPPGTSGELIIVTGHTADSYHVFCQATDHRQDVTVSMGARACCAPPKVEVRPDLLALAFANPEAGLGELQWFPVVPWGEEGGAPQTFSVTGSGTLALPTGARLTHWLAQGTGAGGTLEFDGPIVPGVAFSVGAALPAREGFPAFPVVRQIVYTNLVFGLFEVVV